MRAKFSYTSFLLVHNNLRGQTSGRGDVEMPPDATQFAVFSSPVIGRVDKCSCNWNIVSKCGRFITNNSHLIN